MSLLDKAKAAEVKKPGKVHKYTNDELELIQAWVEDEVTLTQMSIALKRNVGNLYVFIALGLKQVLNDGRKR